jgi:hypothetical protein
MAYFLTSSKTEAVNVTVTVQLDGQDDANGPIGMGGQAPNHSIAIDQGDSTSGTITVTAIAWGKTTAEPVYESDGTTPLVINLATANEPMVRSISNKSLKSIIFTPASMNGTTDWAVTIQSGD